MKTAKSIIVVIFALFTAQIASAYYCPSTGRWLSRDPIGESGFQALQTTTIVPRIGNSASSQTARWIQRDSASAKNEPNIYGFVQNNPIIKFDLFGLYANCCCDSATIDKNKQSLIDRYNAAASYLNPSRPWPMPEEGDWSCLNVARNVGNFMAPTTPCWTCYVENRRSQNIWYPFGGYQSHDLNAVVCVSHPKSGNPQKIVFDYWHNAPAGEDYSAFANNYPYSGGTDMSFSGPDCSQPAQAWSPNNGYLNLISGGPPSPPPPIPIPVP